MHYRKFGRHNFEVPILGFGCMRLPYLDGDDSKIDEAEATRMIRYAIDHGVTYIDTAYPYHKGNSELVVGKALQDGYRQKVRLATKLPVWLTNSYEDFDKYLNEQLQKLSTDTIDFYLLHALSRERWDKIKELDIFKFIDTALKDGRIKHIGFSFHDEIDLFKEIIDAYNWDFCQIQLNYMDETYQAGLEGLKYAAAKNMAIIVMEPLKGGKLAMNPPEAIQEIWNQSEIKRSPAEWALRWVANMPEVVTILSGMSTMEQVVENIQTMENAYPNSLTEKELQLVDKVKEKYKTLIKVDCTACGYCMPCPAGVDIPRNFALYNEASMYNNVEQPAVAYNRFMEENKRAAACVECKQCEEACPQNLPIRQHLKDVHKTLSK